MFSKTFRLQFKLTVVNYVFSCLLTKSLIQESFAQRCFNLIDEYAPGFSSSIIGYDMLTPPDLEREIGLTGTSVSMILYFLLREAGNMYWELVFFNGHSLMPPWVCLLIKWGNVYDNYVLWKSIIRNFLYLIFLQEVTSFMAPWDWTLCFSCGLLKDGKNDCFKVY